MKIMVEKSEMKSLGEEMERISKDLQKINQDLKNTTKELQASWTGASAISFSQKMEKEYYPQIEKFCQSLDEYGNYIKNASDMYQQLENTFASKSINF